MATRLVVSTFAILVLASCASGTSEPEPTEAETSSTTAISTTTSSTTSSVPPSPAEIALERVPEQQREQIASLMVVGVTDFDDALAKLNQGVGGIFIPSWADSGLLAEPGRDIAALREIIDRPFSVSIDYEGGRVQRHSEVLGERVSAQEMAATMTPEQVQNHARELGETLHQHGISINYAPVLDVDTIDLPIVGDRAFSTDPWEVGEYGAAFAAGLTEAGITPVYKHFPGHGQASGDTHEKLAVTPPLEQLYDHDLIPYTVALPKSPGAVMIGHMVVPGLGDGVTPSSLDPATYQLLRSGDYPGGEPFDGLTCTDDLSGMRAITDHYSLGQAVTAALQAGADQALFSSVTDLSHVIDVVDQAVSDGQVSTSQITQSAQRVQLQLLESGV
ncbi:glycoside hydrolase family 3 N-terminal domain-containing protein [Corynebacterium alimapuense]|uniref:beta-N-acetylhexosaminidase n=1 Tax=Corynebacterium alimapuense TaxID=1576874 RepID=A0A3M8KA18_9CORY|nr:beta-N-acetylglucosaminidase [Corynebacterium alimapuense]